MFHLFTEYYVRRAYLQFVHAIPIHKIAFIEDDHLEADASSTSSELDVIYHCKVLWTFGWDRPILI
jgi:hypothetical protein